jgi:hypothetical protein
MMSSGQQFGWLGQTRRGGGQLVLEMSIRDIKFISSQKRGGGGCETRAVECDSRCAAAHAHSVGGTLIGRKQKKINRKYTLNVTDFGSISLLLPLCTL